jgi:hypothetical protein
MLAALEKQDAIDEERANLVRSWAHSGFGVHTERVIEPGSRQELESILQYMERAPVSLKQLTYLDTGMVHYQGRYHPGLGRDHQLVTGVEFLAMLVPHIQHRYQCKIRSYGALSTTLRKRFGWIARAPTAGGAGSANPNAASVPDDGDAEFTQKRGRGWAHFIRKVWIDDPEQCEKCGGRMKIVAALSSPEQDDIIRAILESTGQWDPPWNRRGPPPALTAAPVDSSEPTIEYDIDPDSLWPDD